MDNRIKYFVLTSLELMGVIFTLYVLIRFVIQTREINTNIITNSDYLIFLGLFLIFLSIYLKWKINVDFSYQKYFFQLIFEFLSKMMLIFVSILFVTVYMWSGVIQWIETLTLLVVPLTLFAIFLVSKDFDRIALFFSSDKINKN